MTSIYGKKGQPAKPLTPEMRVRLARLAAQAWLNLLGNSEVALAWVNGEFDNKEHSSSPTIDVADSIQNLYGAASAIAAERRERLLQLRAALLVNDDGEALRLAASLCGVKVGDDEEGYRVN